MIKINLLKNLCTSSAFAAVLWSTAAIAGTGAPVAERQSASATSCPANLLRDGRIGVSTAYVAPSPERLNPLANSLDAAQLAQQAADSGAAWLLFSVHHHNWLLMAPNRTFAGLVGGDQYMAQRDVPADLIKELKKRGVKLMLYVNLRANPEGAADPRIVKAMGAWPPDERLVDNIAAIYREYSLRYGTDVVGWWLDAAGNPAYAQSPHRERWFAKIADALRAGNPRAMLAFSPGLRLARYTPQNSFTAGEMEQLTYVPEGPCAEGVQWHAWTYLGDWWGSDGARFRDGELCSYAKRVLSKGGAITLDLGTLGLHNTGKNGKLTRKRDPGTADPAQIEQISRLTAKMRNPSNADCTN